MRVASIFFAGVLALGAAAQSPTQTNNAAEPTDPAQREIYRCLQACTPGDVNCESKCIAVPNPDVDQVNATNECVAECEQGDGSEAATNAYIQCRDGCIGQHFFTTGGTPAPTGGSNTRPVDDENAPASTTITSGVSSGSVIPVSSATTDAGQSGDAQTTETSSALAAMITGMGPAGVLLGIGAALLI